MRKRRRDCVSSSPRLYRVSLAIRNYAAQGPLTAKLRSWFFHGAIFYPGFTVDAATREKERDRDRDIARTPMHAVPLFAIPRLVVGRCTHFNQKPGHDRLSSKCRPNSKNPTYFVTVFERGKTKLDSRWDGNSTTR